jgi:hypothetical protein
MTEYITEEAFMADLQLSPDFKVQIAESFAEAVEAQTDARLELIADLMETAEVFLEFVRENAIEADGLEEAFSFFCEEFGIDDDEAEILSDFIAENYTVEENEDAPDNETIEEWAAVHIGSWELPDKSVVHVFDRGKKYHTLNRYILKHHDKDGEHLDTHIGKTPAEATKIINGLAARQKSLAAKTLTKEGVEHSTIMEAYVAHLEAPRFMLSKI